MPRVVVVGIEDERWQEEEVEVGWEGDYDCVCKAGCWERMRDIGGGALWSR